jgi:hypothetical protein
MAKISIEKLNRFYVDLRKLDSKERKTNRIRPGALLDILRPVRETRASGRDFKVPQ